VAGPDLTGRELDVMSILWRMGSATVAEVRNELDDDLAYTSVLSALQTLEAKGHIGHTKDGRAYRYHPLVASTQAGGSALSRILDKVYHGSAELLLAQLVTERALDAGELSRMRGLIERRMRGRRK
jgi:BlaI family transcriptional regulator, penicillinase repressor